MLAAVRAAAMPAQASGGNRRENMLQIIRSPKPYGVCIVGSGAAGGIPAKVLTEGGFTLDGFYTSRIGIEGVRYLGDGYLIDFRRCMLPNA